MLRRRLSWERHRQPAFCGPAQRSQNQSGLGKPGTRAPERGHRLLDTLQGRRLTPCIKSTAAAMRILKSSPPWFPPRVSNNRPWSPLLWHLMREVTDCFGAKVHWCVVSTVPKSAGFSVLKALMPPLSEGGGGTRININHRETIYRGWAMRKPFLLQLMQYGQPRRLNDTGSKWLLGRQRWKQNFQASR